MAGEAAERAEPQFQWAEVHRRGSLLCEARWEEGRWRLVKPPASFLEQPPMVVAVKEMVTDRSFPAQVESEFGVYYVREIDSA